MPQVNPTTSAPKVVRNPMRMRWRNIILGLFIGTTLIAGAIIAFYYLELQTLVSIQNSQVVFNKPKITTESAAPTPKQPKVITDETSDWNIYTNSSDRYSLKYPLNYKKVSISKESLDPYTRQNEFQSPDYKVASIGPNTNTPGKGISFYVDVCDPDVYCYPNIFDVNSGKQTGEVSNVKNTILDSVSGKRYNFIGLHGEKYDVVEVTKGGKIFKLELYNGRHDLTSTDLKTFELVISTFKFLE